jgi:predicted nucleotidyltransferase
MEPEYINLIRLLNEEGVEYVVLGGHAVIAHGYLRTTGDVDIFVRPSDENAIQILRVMERYGYSNGEFELADFTKVPSYLSFGRNDGWIDIMTFTLGVSFDQCYDNRLVLNIQGVPVNFIGLQQLLANKMATGRPQDLRDIENLQGEI